MPKGWLTCRRCGGKYRDFRSHRHGKSHSCDKKFGDLKAQEAQHDATARGFTPAAPHSYMLLKLVVDEMIKVPSRYVLAGGWESESVKKKTGVDGTNAIEIDGVMFLPVQAWWVRSWIFGVAKMKMVLPIRRRLITLLKTDEEAWFEFHEPEFQAAMGSAYRLGGQKARETMIRDQDWWRKFTDVKEWGLRG